MFTYVYVLQSLKDGEWYIGKTKDLRKRFNEHMTKKSFATASRGPWRLMFYEAYLDPEDATRREHYLKTTEGHRALRLMLRNYLAAK
ncbi:MAG: GIY-YIG nuclease family protein [bacterium]|nr:GIY-YIG nuclease family protein [bacterium]